MKKSILYFTLSLLIGIANISFAQNCSCGGIMGPNLVNNGGFEYACGSQFPFISNMFQSCAPAGEIYSHPEGVYYIGRGNQFGSSWGSNANTGSSYFVGDGIWAANQSNVAWCQTVNVQAGKTYLFSLFYLYETSVAPPLDLSIFDGTLKVLATSTYPGSLSWTRLCASYTATSSQSIIIGVRQHSLSATLGSDYGIDDITFNSFESTMSVSVPNSTICAGASKTLTASVVNGSGNYSYLWNTGETTQSILVSPTTTTQYTVKVVDLNSSCAIYSTTTVNVTNLNVSIGNDFGMCPTNPNVPIISNVSGGGGSYAYAWSTGAITPNITVNYANPGTYTLTVTENGTGCIATNQINVYQASCQGIKYFQNTSSLPSLTQYNNITAGNHVDVSKPTGDVTVLNGQNVTFEGGSQINLKEGFRANPGSQFRAFIIPGCTFTDLVINQIRTSYCSYRLSVKPTGSGSYSYSWSNGSTNSYIDVAPFSTTTYSLTMTDNCLGTTITTQSQVVPTFRGPIPISSSNYSNLITPNGDGSNDIFVITDGGKQQFAFNSYSFSLNIYNDWGGQVWSQSAYAPLGGFKEGDIYWNPKNPAVSDGAYFMSLTLTNCDNSNYTLKSWIHVLGSGNSSRIALNGDKDIIQGDTILTSAFKIESITVFPNPAFNNLEFKTPQYLDSYNTFTVNVFDSFGAIKLSWQDFPREKLNHTIPIESLTDGIYVVEFIYPNNQKFRTKFTKVSH